VPDAVDLWWASLHTTPTETPLTSTLHPCPPFKHPSHHACAAIWCPWGTRGGGGVWERVQLVYQPATGSPGEGGGDRGTGAIVCSGSARMPSQNRVCGGCVFTLHQQTLLPPPNPCPPFKDSMRHLSAAIGHPGVTGRGVEVVMCLTGCYEGCGEGGFCSAHCCERPWFLTGLCNNTSPTDGPPTGLPCSPYKDTLPVVWGR